MVAGFWSKIGHKIINHISCIKLYEKSYWIAFTEPRPDLCVLKKPYYLHDLNAVPRIRINGSKEKATVESRRILVFQMPMQVLSC